MAGAPRTAPPTAARLAALSARYGSAADAEATRASLLAVLSSGRAVPNSPSPMPTHACPEAEACDTEGLVLEVVVAAKDLCEVVRTGDDTGRARECLWRLKPC